MVPTRTPSAEVTLVRALLAPTRAPGRIPSRPNLTLQDATRMVRASFLRFAERAGDGMAYLVRCWAAGRIDTPVLVSTEQDRIVGAIGPMQTFPSPTAARQLLPQYFAVLPSYRIERVAGSGNLVDEEVLAACVGRGVASGSTGWRVVEHRCFNRWWCDVSAGVASEEAVSMPRSAVPPWRERHRGSE
jgi:hypothetical protein